MTAVADTIQADERGLLLSCPECGRRNRAVYPRLGRTFQCAQCHRPFAHVVEPVELHDPESFEGLINNSALPVLVDFWAPWCGPCKMVAPELIKVARQTAGRLLIAKVNTEELAGPPQRFQVSAIPTLALFKAGQEVARQAGAMPASAILQFLRQGGVA